MALSPILHNELAITHYSVKIDWTYRVCYTFPRHLMLANVACTHQFVVGDGE